MSVAPARKRKMGRVGRQPFPGLAVASLATIAMYTFAYKHCTKTSKGHSLGALPRMISIFHKTMFIN